MAHVLPRPSLPSPDKRWKIVDATMRRHGYAGHALIESLHTVQECFGFIDTPAMRFVANSLNVPLSKAYGASTFYHYFTLKPAGEHTCVVCQGTACYIKGAMQIVHAIESNFGVTLGHTTADKSLSMLSARCIGACALAPAVVIDGDVIGKATVDQVVERTAKKLKEKKVEYAA